MDVDAPQRVTALAAALDAAAHAYGEPARARRSADRALVLAPDDQEVASVAERAHGMTAGARGDFATAVRRLTKAAQIADRAGLPLRAGEARGFLAYILVLTSGAAGALVELDRADASIPAGISAARVQMQRGLVLVELRRFAEALVSLDRALVTCAAAGGDALLEANIYTNRHLAHIGRRNLAQADADLDRAEQLFLAAGHVGRTAGVAHNRGVLLGLRGDVPAALASFDTAAERFTAAGLDSGLLEVERAEVLLAARLTAEARAAAEAAVAGFTRQRNAADLIQARLQLAEAALLDGDLDVAVSQAERARRAALRQGRPNWASLAGYIRLRAGWQQQKATSRWLRDGDRVVIELTGSGWIVQALDARLILARAALALGLDDQANAHLAQARSARTSGLAEMRARAWHAEALARRNAGDRPGAARAVRRGVAVVNEFQASFGASDLRSGVGALTADLASLGVELALAGGRPAAVLAAAEQGRAGAYGSVPSAARRTPGWPPIWPSYGSCRASSARAGPSRPPPGRGRPNWRRGCAPAPATYRGTRRSRPGHRAGPV